MLKGEKNRWFLLKAMINRFEYTGSLGDRPRSGRPLTYVTTIVNEVEHNAGNRSTSSAHDECSVISQRTYCFMEVCSDVLGSFLRDIRIKFNMWKSTGINWIYNTFCKSCFLAKGRWYTWVFYCLVDNRDTVSVK